MSNFLSMALEETQGRIALVIGNGIHRHHAPQSGNDWIQMVQTLATKHGLDVAQYQTGLALTELYDLIELTTPSDHRPQQLQNEFCQGMQDWKPLDHHHAIMEWAVKQDAPVLTTNFDPVLAKAVDARLQSMFEPRNGVKAPTDYYPWEKYFSKHELQTPCDGFGIWHINGMVDHVRSIRLGLTHYMGSVSRARPWLHGVKETRLFTQKDMVNWRGKNTWLHVVFNLPLLIFGLKLETQEVFLRWLLIERARYFRQYTDRKKRAWYVYPASENSSEDEAKRFFLQSIGVQPVKAADYDEIYDSTVWTSAPANPKHRPPLI